MEVLKSYSHIHGIHYSVTDDLEKARRELGYGRRLGLNSVRFWMAPSLYFKEPEAYPKRVRAFMDLCWEMGYSLCPILWNGNFLNPATITQEYWDETGHAYNEAMVSALKDHPGLLMWDVMNEPEYNSYCLKWPGSEEEKEEHMRQMWTFVHRACAGIRQIDDEHPLTVGHAKAAYAYFTEPDVDIISFHDYSGTRKEITATHEAMKALSEKTGKPLINNETGCIARANPYDFIIETAERYGVGYYLFELMIHGYCASEHGIFYDDGSIRDPSTVAAIMGCYRNRDLKTIVRPAPNRESRGTRIVDALEKALKVDTKDIFAYKTGDLTPLLDACDWACCLLEACEAVPMIDLPSARLIAFRAQEHPKVAEVRAFAYELLDQVRRISQIF